MIGFKTGCHSEKKNKNNKFRILETSKKKKKKIILQYVIYYSLQATILSQ